MVALTVFLLEGAVSVVISKAYMWALGSGGVFPRNVFAIVLFLAILLTFWNVTLALWERFNFKFGFEWVIIQIVGKIRGRKSLRLNAGAVLHGSEITVSAE
jgi:hypothetical protein